MPARLIEVGARQVEALKAYGRIGAPELTQEPSGAAADVKESDLAVAPAAHQPSDRAQARARQGAGGDNDGVFVLHVKKAGRPLQKETAGLEMEVLSVVVGDAACSSFGLSGCDVMIGPTPGGA